MSDPTHIIHLSSQYIENNKKNLESYLCDDFLICRRIDWLHHLVEVEALRIASLKESDLEEYSTLQLPPYSVGVVFLNQKEKPMGFHASFESAPPVHSDE